MDLKESFLSREEADGHWYYRAKADAMLRSLRRYSFESVSDIGAGSGFFAWQLLKMTAVKRAVCLDTGYKEDFEETVNGKPLVFKRVHDRVESIDTDLVLMMDVLEHIEDDIGFLQTCVRGAPSGTCFFITVPAFQFLWSGHDVYLDHFRRYTLKAVEGLMKSAGLSVTRGHYFYGALFPVAMAGRLADRAVRMIGGGGGGGRVEPECRMKSHHPAINRAALAMCHGEIPLMRLNRLAGLTAVVLARKP